LQQLSFSPITLPIISFSIKFIFLKSNSYPILFLNKATSNNPAGILATSSVSKEFSSLAPAQKNNAMRFFNKVSKLAAIKFFRGF